MSKPKDFMLCGSLTENELINMDLDEYIGEEKFDGERIIAVKELDEVRLFNRRGLDKSWIYPEVTNAIKMLPYKSVKLDGEIVSLTGLFNDLQRRALLRNVLEIDERVKTIPVVMKLFDILELEGELMTMNSLEVRHKRLIRLHNVINSEALDFVNQYVGKLAIISLWEDIKSKNKEGIIIKHKNSIYVNKRSKAWCKVKYFKEVEKQFTIYELNNAGVKLGNGFDEIQVQGLERANWVINKIQSEGLVKVIVQYLELDVKSGKMRFPSCKEVVGYE